MDSIRRRLRRLLSQDAGDMDKIRDLVIRGIGMFFTWIGPIVVTVGVVEAVSLGQMQAPAVYIAAYIAVALTTIFSRRLSYRLRAVVLFTAMLALAAQNFLLWGLAGVAIPTVIVTSVLATAVFGVQGGLLTVAAGLIPMAVVGTLMCIGRVQVTMDVLHMSSSPVSWLTAAGVVLLYAGVASVSSGLIHRSLQTALEHSREYGKKLDESIRELNSRNAIEELINRISARFIVSECDSMEDELRNALSEFGAAFGADHAAVFLHADEPNGRPSCIQWNKEGTNPLADMHALFTGDGELARRLAEEKQVVFLEYGDDRFGFLYVDAAASGDERRSADITLLNMLADVFTNALARRKDTTERLRIQSQLQQAQKLESIGRLAGGVAHDFNNLLTVILGNSEMALDAAVQGEGAEAPVQEIRAAAQRAASLTAKLLAYSRKQILSPQVFSVNEAVNAVHTMLERIIGEDVAIDILLDDDAGNVRADRNQLEQVIMNLATNARDAMPTGGRFTVSSSAVVLDDQYCASHPGLSPGRYVLLRFSDTGQGMDEETVERIFDPFYTTKAVGEGTGLGLASVYGAVKQSDGHIEVSSEPGRGSVFSIYLPAADGPAEESGTGPEEDADTSGTETVLVVEDEPAIRRLLSNALRNRGYTVVEAEDGRAALSAAEFRSPKAIHVVVTDVVMPNMGGTNVVERLRTHNPELKVVYMSGYAEETAGRHGIDLSGSVLLRKPFSPDLLLATIRKALDG